MCQDAFSTRVFVSEQNLTVPVLDSSELPPLVDKAGPQTWQFSVAKPAHFHTETPPPAGRNSCVNLSILAL